MQWWEHTRLSRRWHARWYSGSLHAWVAGMLMMLLRMLRMLLWILLVVLLRILAVRIHVGA